MKGLKAEVLTGLQVIPVKIASIEVKLILARGTKEVEVLKDEVLLHAKEVDELLEVSVHEESVKDLLSQSKHLKRGVRMATIYLDSMVQRHLQDNILPDGIYYTLRKGRVDGEDEVVAVEEGKVVWKDGYFREVYDIATKDELYRVIEEVEQIRQETDSTTDES